MSRAKGKGETGRGKSRKSTQQRQKLFYGFNSTARSGTLLKIISLTIPLEITLVGSPRKEPSYREFFSG